MSGLWPKNQDLISTMLLLHLVEHLRDNPTYQPRSLTLILNNPVNQNKNNPGHMHNDLDQCFSSPSNYFKANNVMFLPEVPEVFTSSWANREFLRNFRIQVFNLKCCYMLTNYFEACLINYSSLADLFGFHVYMITGNNDQGLLVHEAHPRSHHASATVVHARTRSVSPSSTRASAILNSTQRN
eukprot:m51a1_g14445 hypothetical protein (184) ;mRNA; f:583352-587860